MTRFQIIPSPERNPDAHEILSPPPRRFWRLKAALATVLMGVSSGRIRARRPVLRFHNCCPAGDCSDHRIYGGGNQGCHSPWRESR